MGVGQKGGLKGLMGEEIRRSGWGTNKSFST